MVAVRRVVLVTSGFSISASSKTSTSPLSGGVGEVVVLAAPVVLSVCAVGIVRVTAMAISESPLLIAAISCLTNSASDSWSGVNAAVSVDCPGIVVTSVGVSAVVGLTPAATFESDVFLDTETTGVCVAEIIPVTAVSGVGTSCPLSRM